ncbi:MAG: hypothetical protein [Caudoviricetes sp.]|nr:MAG: hypothetical protein [Caudoviricetes sp.]
MKSKVKKRTCLNCRELKNEHKYTKMANGRLNPKCNDCRNKGRQPIDKNKVEKDDLIIDRTANSFEVKQNERDKAILVLLKAKEIEKSLIKQGKRYVKTGLRSYTLV